MEFVGRFVQGWDRVDVWTWFHAEFLYPGRFEKVVDDVANWGGWRDES
jgi:hypothetical protein